MVIFCSCFSMQTNQQESYDFFTSTLENDVKESINEHSQVFSGSQCNIISMHHRVPALVLHLEWHGII